MKWSASVKKQYMITLVEDLKRDTAQFKRLNRFCRKRVERGDSMHMYLKPPIQSDKIIEYYREAAHIIFMVSYAYNDRTVEQLRQSGNFRLIRKRNVTDSLIIYDNKMRNTFEKNYNFLWDNRIKLNDDLNAIIDNGAFSYIDSTGRISEDSLRKKNWGPLRLITNDANVLMNFYNAAFLQRAYMIDFMKWTDRMKLSSENLILLVQKEYELK